MKNFNVKQSGSEVILEEKPDYSGYDDLVNQGIFEPLILTSIDPNIKVGQVIREDQLEISWQVYLSESWHNLSDKGFKYMDKHNKLPVVRRQVAKLNQPVHETPKSGHDLETCTEKEVDRVETPIQEDETKIAWISINDNLPAPKNKVALLRMNCNYVEWVSHGWLVSSNQWSIKHCLNLTFSNSKPTHWVPIKSVQEHKPESEENQQDLALAIAIKLNDVFDFRYSGDDKLQYAYEIEGQLRSVLDDLGFEITKKK